MKDGYYRIKTWDTMNKLYKETKIGIICPGRREYYVSEMEEELPENRTIKIINNRWKGWVFEPWMTAEYLGETLEEPDESYGFDRAKAKKVLVWEDEESYAVERILLFANDDGSCLCVVSGSEGKYYHNEKFGTFSWKHWKPIPDPIPEPEDRQPKYKYSISDMYPKFRDKKIDHALLLEIEAMAREIKE